MAVLFLVFLLYPPALSLQTSDVLKELSWPTQLMLFKETIVKNAPSETPQEYDTRQIGEPLFIPRSSDDENQMRLKLFRLMYESVKDSDEKVKKAELIKDNYENSTAFQIGYLISDVNEKFKIMRETAASMQRFYDEWKPLEHVNAYEQVVNSAVEVRQLVDLVRLVAKKEG